MTSAHRAPGAIILEVGAQKVGPFEGSEIEEDMTLGPFHFGSCLEILVHGAKVRNNDRISNRTLVKP